MKTWGKLAQSTRTRYVRKGVTGVRYNAWTRASKRKKAAYAKLGITRDAYLQAPDLKALITGARVNYAARAAYATLAAAGVMANLERMEEHLATLSPSLLVQVPRLSADELRRRARKQPERSMKGWKDPDVNPFWYH